MARPFYFTEDEELQIVKTVENGATPKAVAKDWCVCLKTVYNILNRHRGKRNGNHNETKGV